MDLSDVQHMQYAEVDRRLQRGMSAWAVPVPLNLDAWGQEHFYLSAESSYVEQRWVPWPFQRALMACISNDDIHEIDVMKSARMGYTKILLAGMGYFAEHKRRNQCLWQPTDDDATAFVKSELDTMLRDVPIMRSVFPAYLARHKDNTLESKKFIGSMAYIKGGKAAKNYRRISVDVAVLDELDAFDSDIEKEGDPVTLASKRIEGATFGKLICGSTPKLKGFSLIEGRAQLAEYRVAYNIRCPHCHDLHPLTWGGKDEPHGFKWVDNDPDSVRHQCPHCSALITQGEYLAIWADGFYISDCGTLWLHNDGRFTTPDLEPVETPKHIAFRIWTAYSPAASWPTIVREFQFAHEKMQQGDDAKMKAFKNTTLGESWEGEIERTDDEELKARAEAFPLRRMPRDCLLLLCGCDTQDNRLEAAVWGYGIGGQMWTIDHQVFFGNPAQETVWRELEEFLLDSEYQHVSGLPQKIFATAIDSGGHHTDAVYAFAHKHRARRIHAIKGSNTRERSIENGNAKVGYKHNGKIEKNGPVLWHIGTNLAKDRFAARLEITTPGPGYVHLSRDMSDEWFRQLAGEDRVTRRMQYGTESRWTANRKRIEVRDCLAYTIWLEERLDLWSLRKAKWWQALQDLVQPSIDDLFSQPDAPPPPERPARAVRESEPRPPAPAAAQRPPPTRHTDLLDRIRSRR